MLEATDGQVYYARFSRRVFGLCIDFFLWFFVIMAIMVFIGQFTSESASQGMIYVWMAGFVLYEPILLPLTGGTVGHRLMNLRVSRDRDGQNVGFLSAFVRVFLKGALGILSFFFMALSRRNQALHDLLTRSHVHLRDAKKAKSTHFVLEREELAAPTGVSTPRRVGAILGYSLVAMVMIMFAPFPFVSEACMLNDLCSETDDLVFSLVGLVLTVALGLILILGWRGKLPGARAKEAEH